MGKKEYTIKIIPEQGGTVHSIRLPLFLLRYGIASLAFGLLLFVGAFSYAAYSVIHARSDATEIDDLREVNNIQQEQLLQLSKRANALQDEMDKLNQRETELRRLSGAGAAEKPEGEEGQGGPYPYVEAKLEEIQHSIDLMERTVAQRKVSLGQLQEHIQAQQEIVASMGFMGLPVSIVNQRNGIGTHGMGANTPSIWPAPGTVSSPYGLRWGGSDFHPGIDIANEFGTPIRATADGVVTTAGWNSGGYGNMVDIDHGGGLTTRYGHAQQVVVSEGQHVQKGQVIAYMGSTGFSTGPHVHYEVIINGQRVNPAGYL